MEFKVTKLFHPVGQGLFSSATLQLSGNDAREEYTWVYDCGTHSSQSLVKREIARLSRGMRELDLLVLSHFDADHVSGVSTLIGQIPTRRIMLPYIDLAHRLVLAFEQGLTGEDDLTGFYISPPAYLMAQARDPDIEFLFVPPSSPDAPPGPPGTGLDPQPDDFPPDDDTPDAKRRAGRLKDIFILEKNPSQPIADDLSAMRRANPGNAASLPKISLLKKGGKIEIVHLWEFVPYNDPLPMPRNFQIFADEVRKSRDDLLSANSGAARKSALGRLKQIYDRHLQGSDKRNRGSLFVFEGPIKAAEPAIWVQKWPSTFDDYPERFTLPIFRSPSKGRFFMTGDGVVSKPAELSSLEQYYGPARMGDILALQVMHHGSERNWHSGLASHLAPGVSIFCADPSRRQPAHPDAPVVRDFLPFNPILADQHNGILIHALY